ncbi:hypothetical protein [Sandaracinus amylolyticus]|uniref:hypothetical protein n=1 Tax=Sandaracinus amylolyticus TaxID=927083 RepID=UPI001F4246A2|nr:hypothetical protein [Sandaracinus amylolyticus]UJR79263.1 Hypothetical protein I5071_12960 [Sandaracinus amylolyticus]
MRTRGQGRASWAIALIALAGCTGEVAMDGDAGTPRDGGEPPRDGARPSGEDAQVDASTSPIDGGPVATTGEIALTLRADRGAAADAVVSLGVPFAPGVLRDAALVRLIDASDTEREVHVAELARWPLDGSIRSVLVAFRTTLAANAEERWTIEYGAPRTRTAPSAIAPAPDGPVAATLDAAYYGRSRVSGPHLAIDTNDRFEAFDTELESRLVSMSPGYETYGVSCSGTNAHRTYYDGPHALWQRFVRGADAARHRRARLESTWYRDNELEWISGREMAVQVCQPDGWTPSQKLDWGVMRRMTGQGMLDDYLLTGDPAAREAVIAMGEAFVRSLPAQRGGRENSLRVTERNLAWTIIGVASYYALDPRDEVRAALVSLIDEAVDWQSEGTSGAFEHDLVRPDPEECSEGPAGGSPFMTSLLIDGLMDAHALTGDARIADVVRGAAEWLRDDAVTSDGVAFRYLWGCSSDAYDDSGTADLNLLIVHVFGAAYVLTGDAAWLDVGDEFADHGVEAMYVGRPKQWNQSGRAFPRYLGYRALGRTP